MEEKTEEEIEREHKRWRKINEDKKNTKEVAK
ncbi:hypothetical protein LCGC14_1774490 [marine sediment metagenome]|uniref:Uncharacterized protein n=1 Tax=marine sediment metagenome TaxID=412755 RepID=A0A0F9HJS8_9ZZZZ